MSEKYCIVIWTFLKSKICSVIINKGEMRMIKKMKVKNIYLKTKSSIIVIVIMINSNSSYQINSIYIFLVHRSINYKYFETQSRKKINASSLKA